MDEREDTVGRLLEGTTNFSRDERDEIFDGVFAAVQAEEPSPATARPAWMRWLAWAAVICFAVVPASIWLNPGEPSFVARGADGNLRLECSGARGCSIGDALTFDLSNPPRPWFAAFARSTNGTVVWYFPEADTAKSVGVQDGLLSRAVTLGPEHSVGAWTVYAVFSDGPLDRPSIRAAFSADGKLDRPDTTLIKRTLTIR